MKIEEGKFYKTRDGRKVGPAIWIGVQDWPWDVGDGNLRRPNGEAGGSGMFGKEYDLISEWPSDDTGPIRTITRREIVLGVHGNVRIFGASNGEIQLAIFKHTNISVWASLNKEELREAAHLFNQLAEYLESKEGE